MIESNTVLIVVLGIYLLLVHLHILHQMECDKNEIVDEIRKNAK